jgi:DNA recombination protein RmuC
MSAVSAKLTDMDTTTVIIAVGALILGLAVGLIAGQRLKRSGSPADTLQLEKDLAAANATVLGLSAQVAEAARERKERDDREKAELAEQNKILQELAPVQENIRKMQQKVDELERERIGQFNTIKTQLDEAKSTNTVLAANTSALQNALSNNQARGKWGEVQLRNLLQSAGMTPHVDFLEQFTGNNAAGDLIRPDCIIKYPDEKYVPIDSKFPMQDFERAIRIPEVASTEDEKSRKTFMKAHTDAVKKHIKEISGKNYYTALSQVEGLESAPEFTILFVPNDGILAATLAEDPSVMEYAFSNQVALVSPNSLFGVLRTIQHIWRSAAQEETIRDILRVGVDLYSRMRTVATHAAKMGTQLDGAVSAYNSFVSSVERNLLTTTRELNKRSLGMLDDNKPIAELTELSETTNKFTKAELAEGEGDEPKAIK